MGTEFRLERKNLMTWSMTIVIDLRLFLKTIWSSGVASNCMFINQNLSLLVERTRMVWKTMSIPDLVNLEN